MKIIGLTGQKGGTGKSTLAINLAAWFAGRGFATSVLDRDAQGAVKRSSSRGDDTLPFAVHADIRVQLGNVISARRRQGDDIVIIDTAPSIGGAFREVPKFADLILLPTRPAPKDVDSLYTAYGILTGQEFERKKVYAVLTQVFRNFKITKETIEALDALGLPYLATQIMHRTIYQTTDIEGQTVFSVAKNQAAEEIDALGKEIAKLLDIKLTKHKR